jgi:crotonobetainyl-CoA:carnitine CoA-transferase CaiB-like acyl-CoA transferase
MSKDARQSLEGIRVLDFATSLGEAAGRVFADLGAEVIKIEPPGGCESRFAPPFAKGFDRDSGDPEASLFWRAWGLGKHSVELDIESQRDRACVVELVRSADVLIESFTPGVMDAHGLGQAELRALNPALIYVSVTPFGQTGPYAKHPATDLTLSAAGGLLNMQGEGDRPPFPVGVPETAHLGAVQAAADAIMALYARNRTGAGQHLDSSAQAAVLWSLMYVTDYAAFEQDPPGFGEDRVGRLTTTMPVMPGLTLPVIEPCKDGFVAMTLVLGAQGAFGFNAVMNWIGSQGGLDADLMDVDWMTWIQQCQEGTMSLELANRGVAQFLAFLKTMTKAEIQEQAVAQKWLIAPINTAPDLLADVQLRARDYWVEIDGSPLPGPFAILGETPIRYDRPAPKLGADQHLASEIASSSRQPAAPTASTLAPRERLFEGLKVADLSWIAAGPLISKDLANLGATVVRVETENRIDTLRFLPPWKGDPGIRTGHTAANMNQSKYGLALDFTTPKGREIAHRLVEWADVVVQNFTPGTAERLGLDYETLRKKNPDLVMLYTCMRGQTGPERKHTGFGLHGASLGGFVAITGWPDRAPQAPWGAYTDFISPRYAQAALAAALYHRDVTGEGQCIDVSQIEAAIHYLAPTILDYTENGRVVDRAGHDSEWGCPHGVYPTQGVERYVAIEVRRPDQWQALCRLAPGVAAAAGDDASLTKRLASRKEIDVALTEWCETRDAFDAALQLREAGVPAYVPLRATDFHADAQLQAREFFIELDHAGIGRMRFDGAVTTFSATPSAPKWAGPLIGEHTFEIMQELLGYSEDEIAEIAASGALT